MTSKEKLSLLEKMLDIDEGTLNEDAELDNLDNWDSMAAISLIALMDENFNKTISAIQIKQFDTVKDILHLMG